ncbi:MAG: PKD domain-containing protein [Thermoplasmatales archaeon]|nr:PKD domain-containing protein [Thermoplasmatales archaeon]
MSNVPSSATSKGETWYFTVRPKDGTEFGELRTAVNTTILNSIPTADAGSNQTSDTNIALFFNASLSFDPDNDIVNWIWDFADGNMGYGEITTHSYLDDGVYNVTLAITDSSNVTDNDTIIIAINNRVPTANAGSDQKIKVGATIMFTGTSSDSDGSIVLYEWDFDGNGIYEYASEITGVTTHKYTEPGTYYATLRVTDDDGATSTDTIVINVEKKEEKPGIIPGFDMLPMVIIMGIALLLKKKMSKARLK